MRTDPTTTDWLLRDAEDPGLLPGWSELAADAPVYAGVDWQRFVDSDGAGRPRYLGAYDPAGAAAVLSVHRVERETNPRYVPASVLGQPVPPAVLLGGRRGYLSTPLVRPGGPAVAALSTLLAAAAAAGDWWWPYLTRAGSELVRSAAGPGAEVHLLDADCVLTVPPGDVESYVRSLRSKQGRTNVRRDLRRFAESGLVVTRHRLAECDLDLLGRLASAVQGKYGLPDVPATMTAVLARQVRHLDARSVVFLCRRPGDRRPIAFSLAYRTAGGLCLRLVGFDYDRLPGAAEYAQLAVYEPVRFCQQHGLTELHLGMSSYEAKTRRGADVRPLWTVTSFPLVAPGPGPGVARRVARELTGRALEQWQAAVSEPNHAEPNHAEPNHAEPNHAEPVPR